MSGWGIFGSESKSKSPSNGSKGGQKSSQTQGRTRDPAASAMAASLGIDTSAFDLPDEENTFQMSAEDEARLQEALRLAQDPMEDIDESKISDKDLEDPELLSQLAHIEGGGELPKAHSHADGDKMDVDDDEISGEVSKRQKTHDSEPDADVLNKIRLLEAAIKKDRDVAIQLKRDGKMDEARKALIQMKQRQKQVEDLRILAGDSAGAGQPSALQAPAPRQTQIEKLAAPLMAPPSPTTPKAKAKAPASSGASPSPRANPQVKLVHQRMLDYKQAILDAKDSGDVETAQKLFEYFKRLQQIQSDLAEGVTVDASAIPPPPPEDPSTLPPLSSPVHQIQDDEDDMDVVDGPSSSNANDAAATQDAALKRLKTFALLENMLVKQITAYHNRALQEKNAGRKAEAINLLRQKKQWMSDLDLIRLAQASGAKAPLYHIETIEHKTEIVHDDLSQHEMEIEVVRLIDVKPPSLEDKTLDLYVTCEIPYPNPEKPQRFQSPTAKQSLSPEFAYKQKMRIERNPNFQRFLKNRRLSFEVFRPASWFLGRATSIGKAELKLADLLERSEIVYQLDIMEGRKVNGGKLEARVRLRTPANPQSKHFKISQEKLLLIDKHFSAADSEEPAPQPSPLKVEPVASGPSPSRPRSPEPVVASNIMSASVAPTPVSSPVSVAVSEPLSQSTPATPAPQEALPDYESLEWIVSNAVMESELAKVQQQIETHKKAGQEVPIDLELRAQQLSMKMEILVIQIQQGQVTVESYMEMLQKKVPEEKALALQLKRLGRLEEAKQALLRAKLMEREAAGE